MSELQINATRLHDNLHNLGQIGRAPDGSVNRVAFTDADIEGRDFTIGLMRSAGLAIRTDAAGNIFGSRAGTASDAPAILLGSHIDTVPGGGAYDGAVGVLAAIEVVQALVDHRHDTHHAIEVVAWSDEEGGLSGSRGFIGDLGQAELTTKVAAGMTLGEGIKRIGGDPERIAEACCPHGKFAAYLELHVEQGNRLESEERDIGVVTGIVGIRHYGVTFKGTPNHAGTTPMHRRNNALLAASEFVLAVDRIVKSIEGTHVGTVGEMTVRPGAPNVIPGEVNLTVELRDLDMPKIDSLWAALQPEMEKCASNKGTTVEATPGHQVESIPTDSAIRDAIAAAAEDLGLSHCAMPSGAGHDAQNLARIARTGMIFVPSVGGVSHSGAEFTKPEDVEHGTGVLLNALLRLDRARM